MACGSVRTATYHTPTVTYESRRESIMKAIQTRAYGPTNRRGARISAWTMDQRIIIARDHELSDDANHARAAILLCNKMQWPGCLAQGHIDNDTNVFVFVPDDVNKVKCLTNVYRIHLGHTSSRDVYIKPLS